MDEKIEKIREQLDELIKVKADYSLILEKAREFDMYMNIKLGYV